MPVLFAYAVLGGVLALAILTSLGARRRGDAAVVALLSGFFFPATWVVWYLLDERPG